MISSSVFPRYPEYADSNVDYICDKDEVFLCLCSLLPISSLPHAKGQFGSFLGERTRGDLKTGNKREKKNLGAYQ